MYRITEGWYEREREREREGGGGGGREGGGEGGVREREGGRRKGKGGRERRERGRGRERGEREECYCFTIIPSSSTITTTVVFGEDTLTPLVVLTSTRSKVNISTGSSATESSSTVKSTHLRISLGANSICCSAGEPPCRTGSNQRQGPPLKGLGGGESETGDSPRLPGTIRIRVSSQRLASSTLCHTSSPTPEGGQLVASYRRVTCAKSTLGAGAHGYWQLLEAPA